MYIYIHIYIYTRVQSSLESFTLFRVRCGGGGWGGVGIGGLGALESGVFWAAKCQQNWETLNDTTTLLCTMQYAVNG